MLFKNLHINPDSVELDDQLIERPFYMAPSVWVGFWEEITQETSRNEILALEDELDTLEKENQELGKEVCDLEFEVKKLERQLADAESEIADLEKQLSGKG